MALEGEGEGAVVCEEVGPIIDAEGNDEVDTVAAERATRPRSEDKLTGDRAPRRARTWSWEGGAFDESI